MSDPNGWSMYGTWFTNVLLLIFLGFLWFQVKEMKHRLSNHVLQSYWSIWIEIDKWFVANAELRPFFYHGKDTDETVNTDFRMKLESTAEMFLDCFSNIYLQRDVIPPEEERCIRAFMNDTYKSQPVFHRFVDDHRSWYSPDFIDYLTSRS
jgi:hypothetical protein